MVPCRIEQAVERAWPEDRGIIAAAWAMTDPNLLDRQFLDSRQGAPRGLQQGHHAAGGDRVIKTFLLNSSANDQAAVAPRHEISSRRPKHVIEQRSPCIHAQRQHLAFDRPHRRTTIGRQTADASRPSARGHHHHVGRRRRSAFEDDPLGAAASDGNLLDGCMFVNFDAGAFCGKAQGLHQLAIIHLMILRREHRPRNLPGQMRLLAAGLRR